MCCYGNITSYRNNLNLRSGNWDKIRNKGIEPALGPRGALNQDEHIRYEGSPARYDRSAATLPNYKNGGRRYGATGPTYIPAIDRSQLK